MAVTNYAAMAKRYAEQVVAGEVLACRWVQLACQRQLNDLARFKGKGSPYRFNPKLLDRDGRSFNPADNLCAFIERLPHVKGPLAGESISLEPWQVFILSTVFGWVKDDGKRRFRRSYIEVPRGNAKSTLSSAVALYMLAADREGGAEVYSLATTRDQARIVFGDAQTMARRSPGFRSRFSVNVGAHNMHVLASGSKFEALSAEGSTLDGLNIHFGCVDELHAHKTRTVYDVVETGTGKRDNSLLWVITTAGSNRYRRRLIRFTTEMEGFIPAFGDLIAVQHDMPGWGQFAQARGWDPASRTLTLTEPLTWNTSSGGAHYIGLRTKQGGVDGPYEVTQGASPYQVILQQAPAQPPYVGSDYERTQVAFGWAQTWRQLAKVIAIRPRGLYQVEIEAINEDPSVHTAESGQVAPPVQTSQLTTLYTTPLIADLTLRSSTTDNSKALLTWTPAPGADSYQIEMAAGVSPYAANLTWTRVGETSANNFAVTALYGVQTLIRVRGVGLTAGPWVALFYGSSADYMWVNDAALMWSADPSKLMWRY